MTKQLPLFETPEPIRAEGGASQEQATPHARRGPRWLNPRTVARLTAEQREEYRQIIKQEEPKRG